MGPRRQAEIRARNTQTPGQERMAREFAEDVENRYQNSMRAEREALRPLRQTDAAIKERLQHGLRDPASISPEERTAARGRLQEPMPDVNRIMREAGHRPIRGYAAPSEYAQG